MQRWIRSALFAAFGLLFAVTAMGATLKCDITSKFACSPSGCVNNNLGVWNLIDLDAKRFSRCGESGCDTYDMTSSQSGVYVNFEIPRTGMLAKMAADGGQYVEVVTAGTGVLVSYGSCK